MAIQIHALVRIGKGKKAHKAVFSRRARYDRLIAENSKEVTFTNCAIEGVASPAPGEFELCQRCFPYTSSASAYEYRQRHQDVL